MWVHYIIDGILHIQTIGEEQVSGVEVEEKDKWRAYNS